MWIPIKPVNLQNSMGIKIGFFFNTQWDMSMGIGTNFRDGYECAYDLIHHVHASLLSLNALAKLE